MSVIGRVQVRAPQLRVANMSQRTSSNVASASTSATAPKDDMGTIVEPSPANKSSVRIAAVIAACAAGGLSGWGTAFVPSTFVMVVHLLSASIWVGVNVWTTFFAGITMFRALERRTFGKLQSKLFPLCASSPLHSPVALTWRQLAYDHRAQGAAAFALVPPSACCRPHCNARGAADSV